MVSWKYTRPCLEFTGKTRKNLLFKALSLPPIRELLAFRERKEETEITRCSGSWSMSHFGLIPLIVLISAQLTSGLVYHCNFQDPVLTYGEHRKVQTLLFTQQLPASRTSSHYCVVTTDRSDSFLQVKARTLGQTNGEPFHWRFELCTQLIALIIYTKTYSILTGWERSANCVIPLQKSVIRCKLHIQILDYDWLINNKLW